MYEPTQMTSMLNLTKLNGSGSAPWQFSCSPFHLDGLHESFKATFLAFIRLNNIDRDHICIVVSLIGFLLRPSFKLNAHMWTARLPDR